MLMDAEQAKGILNRYQKQRFALLGEAIDCLLATYGNYKTIADHAEPSSHTISKYHRISRLPRGILWQLEEGSISLGIAEQLSRLSCEDDKWRLAFFVVDIDDGSFSVQDCREVVTRIEETGRSAEQVLTELTGETFERTYPLALPVDFKFRFALARASWSHETEWPDLCYRVISEWLEKQDAIQDADGVPDALAYVQAVVRRLASWNV